jgi:hypothetical protein
MQNYPAPKIMFLNTVHRPVYIFKHNVSETGFCLRLQVKPIQLGPIARDSPYLRTPVPASRWGIQASHRLLSALMYSTFCDVDIQ